jgi:hypothetical protein
MEPSAAQDYTGMLDGRIYQNAARLARMQDERFAELRRQPGEAADRAQPDFSLGSAFE